MRAVVSGQNPGSVLELIPNHNEDNRWATGFQGLVHVLFAF
jgi:hypothetical protein